MRTSISNLNGDQQNVLNHLSKNLKRAVRPLMIICYGHRSGTTFQSSAFSSSGMVKKNHSAFDIFMVIDDSETLPDSSLLEIARRSCNENLTSNMIMFRMKDVVYGLQHKSRFFACIFRNGILLYGNKNALNMLPHPLPPACFTNNSEKERLQVLLQHAQQCIRRVDQNLQSEYDDPQLNIILLNESAVYAARYFILACWGIEPDGDLRTLLDFSANISNALTEVFPRSSMEELILFHVIGLSFIDEGFCPGPLMIRSLFKRITSMISVSQSCVQRKMAQLLPA
ncbi:MAG TPA: hypothetical protein VGC08_00445 [Pedobacter sp.]